MTTTTEASSVPVRANAKAVLALTLRHADDLDLVGIAAGRYDGDVTFRTNADAETFAERIGAEVDELQNAAHAKAGYPYRAWVTPDRTVRVTGWGQ